MGTPDVRPAAWYLDPSRRHEYRWWNGADWTEHVSDQGRPSVDAPVASAPTIVITKKRTKWPWVVAVVFILGVGGCFAVFHQAVENLRSHAHKVGTVAVDPGTASPPASRNSFKPGDVIEDGDWTLTIRGVQDPYVPQSSYVKAKPGMHYIALDLSVTNTSKKIADFPEFTVHIEDPAGHRYVESLFVGATGAPRFDGRNLDPSANARGPMYFEVPDAPTRLTLVFWPSPLADKARVVLT